MPDEQKNAVIADIMAEADDFSFETVEQKNGQRPSSVSSEDRLPGGRLIVVLSGTDIHFTADAAGEVGHGG